MKCTHCEEELDAVSVMIAGSLGLRTCGGNVWWLGLRWYGLPMPVRCYAWARVWIERMQRERRIVSWPSMPRLAGCGCIAVLKAAWLRLRPIPVDMETKTD